MNKKAHLLVALGWLGSLASPLAQTIYPQELSSITFNTEDVLDFKLSPDGTRVVYRQNKFRFVIGEGSELPSQILSVPVSGGPPVNLTGGFPFGAQAVYENYEISPDGSRVVFLADKEEVGLRELYSVPIGGGTPVKLNGTLVAGGEVFSARISPSSDRVVYLARQDSMTPDLYSVPIDGGANVSLSGGQPGTGGVVFNEISPDGTRVIYLADRNTPFQDELFSVPITGGASTRLNDTLPAGGEVKNFPAPPAISPDGTVVVYRADQNAVNVVELYSSPITGGGSTRIVFSSTGGDVDDFEISPTGDRVVFCGAIEQAGRVELFSKPITGGGLERLHPYLEAGESILSFEVSPDGTQVVFRGILDTALGSQIYASTIDTSLTTRQLSPVTVPGGQASAGYRISPDSQRVLYIGETTTLGTRELLSVPISGGAVTTLNGPLAPGGSVFRIADVGVDGRVLYLADEDTDSVAELYSVPIEGGSAVKINGALPPGGDVRSEVFFVPVPPSIAAGGRIVYLADQETDETLELYVGKAQESWQPSTGEWLTGSNWSGGAVPDRLIEAFIDVPALVRVGAGSVAEAELLVLGGAAGGPSILELVEGATVEATSGAALGAGAIIRGDGVFSVGTNALTVPIGAEVRVAAGGSLLVQSGDITNAGRFEALGQTGAPAEFEFVGEVTTVEGRGAIVGSESILRFPNLLQNAGSLSLASGLNNIFGDIVNRQGGLVVVTGGAMAVFFDDFNNGGNVNVSAAGGTVSTAVFLGDLSGNGIGGSGSVFIEGDTRPGESPGTMAFGGDLTYGPFAVMDMEIGGTEAETEHDQITVSGHLTLDGTLNVTLINDFVPQAGMVFDLWDAGSVSGQYSAVSLPALPAGLFWNTCFLNTTGELFVALVPDSYAGFAAHYGLVTLPDGDEEGDKLSNAIEYLAGRNPLQADVWPAIGATASEISFVSTAPAAKDLVVELERSTTLQSAGPGGWEVIATRNGNGPWSGTVTVQLSSAGPGLERASVSHTTAGDVRRFYRLKVTHVP